MLMSLSRATLHQLSRVTLHQCKPRCRAAQLMRTKARPVCHRMLPPAIHLTPHTCLGSRVRSQRDHSPTSLAPACRCRHRIGVVVCCASPTGNPTCKGLPAAESNTPLCSGSTSAAAQTAGQGKVCRYNAVRPRQGTHHVVPLLHIHVAPVADLNLALHLRSRKCRVVLIVHCSGSGGHATKTTSAARGMPRWLAVSSASGQHQPKTPDPPGPRTADLLGGPGRDSAVRPIAERVAAALVGGDVGGRLHAAAHLDLQVDCREHRWA